MHARSLLSAPLVALLAFGATPALAANPPAPRVFRSGIIPARHLAKFLASATPTVCAMSDSTWSQANYVSGSDALGSKIAQRLREDYPEKTITFKDFSIGGTSLSQWNSTVTGANLPPFYTPTAATWASFPAAAGCTTLFVNFGVNDTGYESAATFAGVFANIVSWPTVPDVILVTNAIANQDAAAPFNTASFQAGYRANAALQRTLASSGMTLGAAAMPPLGLIDVGRYFSMSVLGADPAVQWLSYSVNPVAPVSGVTAFPYALPPTPGGDFDVTVSFDNAGSSYVAAGSQIAFSVADPLGGTNSASTIYFIPNGGSALYTNYYYNNGGTQITGFGSVWNNTSAGNTLRVIARGGRLQAYGNGALLMDVLAPRSYTGFTPRVSLINPPAAASMTVQAYAVGTPRAYAPSLSPADCYGGTGATNQTSGNGINHDSSVCLNFVYGEALEATTFR